MGDIQWNNIFILPSYYYYFLISDSNISIFHYYHILRTNFDIYVFILLLPYTDQCEQVEDCARDTFVFFITVTEVYLVVPGYQIHLVSVHRKSWLVYQHVFLYYSDGNLPCSARIPDTSGVSTPEELPGLPTCFKPQCPTRKSKR
jgi:hypothetical protein